jgi:hypothetical protein
MPDPRLTDQAPDGPDPTHEIARELLGVLPFGARADALARCPRIAERVDGDGDRAVTAVVEGIESFTAGVHLLDRHPEPLTAPLVRRMLHVLLATRDLGWPGLDAPLSVRRVAAADLFFDATQTVLADDDWKGPHGVEFALLLLLAGRVCHAAPMGTSGPPAGWGHEPGGERLGQLHRVRHPRER